MPSWGEVLKQIKTAENPLNTMRHHYLDVMHQYTGRNVIAYYSAFIQKPGITGTSIDDNDKNAFMQAVYKLDRDKGLDLILHTPGGNVAATESIVIYLKKLFGRDIRVFVPQIAMSAGTMIALSSKEIVMGKQSNLGPIDPQFGGMSCAGIIEEFEDAAKAVSLNPQLSVVWGPIIGKYHPTFLGDCKKAIDWSESIVKGWLIDNMFYGHTNAESKAKCVLDTLSSHKETYSHSRHIHDEELKALGLNIVELEKLDNRNIEDCNDLQDCVLTLHHSYMHSLAQSNAVKIIENHNGEAFVTSKKKNDSKEGE